ncbi:hypothetical protein, partial [Ferrovibrio sp.]|uniref:hypothetical protein n=1 Tax=Ferrovibrio sp. TaxID=1917215 RepID=UPI00345BBDFD
MAVSILGTEFDLLLTTYTVLPSGVTATASGYGPTVMVLVTVSLSPRREDDAVTTAPDAVPAAFVVEERSAFEDACAAATAAAFAAVADVADASVDATVTAAARDAATADPVAAA